MIDSVVKCKERSGDKPAETVEKQDENVAELVSEVELSFLFLSA